MNQLTQVKNSGGSIIASFTYDDQGRRISSTVSGTIYKYHYSGDKVIYITDGNNNILNEFSYDIQGNPATMIYNGATYYYHVDGHGNVTALTDASGNTAAQYTYDAWGNILTQSGTIASANPLRYSGYMYDGSTGLYYLMARYYDPGVGRFITRDAFHGFEDDPQSLNQYAYCHNNPVMFADPSGHWAKLYHYWWGVKLTISNNTTLDLIDAMNIGAGTGAIITILAGAGVVTSAATLPAGLISGILWIGGSYINMVNRWGKYKGIYISKGWLSPPTIWHN
ncbi:MAG TPA: RHS repeat-associated core domain-containing protein [Anaerovoracaceae bacterium]|nr:RHS repeat-associated core domain-containing protein [Anaerovoracaceae bacterium]